jgi:hypothetical protein
MQIQLLNGWETTNYGKKMTYDDYLRLLSTKNSQGPVTQLPGGMPKIGPSPANVQNWFQSGPGNQPNMVSGPATVNSNVDVTSSTRGYYG